MTAPVLNPLTQFNHPIRNGTQNEDQLLGAQQKDAPLPEPQEPQPEGEEDKSKGVEMQEDFDGALEVGLHTTHIRCMCWGVWGRGRGGQGKGVEVQEDFDGALEVSNEFTHAKIVFNGGTG